MASLVREGRDQDWSPPPFEAKACRAPAGCAAVCFDSCRTRACTTTAGGEEGQAVAKTPIDPFRRRREFRRRIAAHPARRRSPPQGSHRCGAAPQAPAGVLSTTQSDSAVPRSSADASCLILGEEQIEAGLSASSTIRRCPACPCRDRQRPDDLMAAKGSGETGGRHMVKKYAHPRRYRWQGTRTDGSRLRAAGIRGRRRSARAWASNCSKQSPR